MSRRVAGVGATVVVVVGCVTVVWFLLRQHGVEKAGAWAGVFGLLGLQMSVWGLWLVTKPIVRSALTMSMAAHLQGNKAGDSDTTYALRTEPNSSQHGWGMRGQIAQPVWIPRSRDNDIKLTDPSPSKALSPQLHKSEASFGGRVYAVHCDTLTDAR